METFIYLPSFLYRTNMRYKRGFRSRGNSQGSSTYPPLSSTFFSKRGQVTVFIIVGIVILFAFAGILYFNKSVVQERITAEGDPILAQALQEFVPLQSYTENCLNQIGRRGLRILGEQGGYIYPNIMGEYSAINPTDADGIDLEPAKVPYWHYNPEPNNANKITFSSLQPKLYAVDDPEMSIEAQLGRYVDEKLTACLNGYEPFLGSGFSVQIISDAKTEVRVGESTVNFLLNLEVDAAKGEAQHDFDMFFMKIELPLKKYYELASSITTAEQNYSFLEKQGLDLVQVYSGFDLHKLPPTSGATFDIIPTLFWNTLEVEAKMKEMLMAHVPLLRLASSNNFYRYEYPAVDLSGLYQQTYDNMILPLDGKSQDITFDYFDWNLYLNTNDEMGVIKPTHVSTPQLSFLPSAPFATQAYSTLYDVSYPVLVTIHDPQVLDKEGYSFQIALEANIRNNEPAHADQILTEISPFNPTDICDQNKFGTEVLKTIVIDSSTKEPLEAVSLGFTVPDQDTCTMGLTNGQGVLESTYPAVYGGVLSMIKSEYLTNFYPIDTYKYKESSAVIGYAVEYHDNPVMEMHPFKLLNITVKKKNLEKCIEERCFFSSLFVPSSGQIYSYVPATRDEEHRWLFTGATQQLESNEEATIILTRVSDLNTHIRNDPYGTAVTLSAHNAGQEIELVPGIYEVTAFLTIHDDIIIPEEERCTDDIILGFGEECFTLDETVVNPFIAGQLEWTASPAYLEITPEQLYGSSELEFYLPYMHLQNVPLEEHLRVIEDLQVMGQLGNFSQLLRDELEPRWR